MLRRKGVPAPPPAAETAATPPRRMGLENALDVLLARWCRTDPAPLVLLVDEAERYE